MSQTEILQTKDMTPYETLRTAIYDERIWAYRDEILERELIQLEQGEKKIDHPATHNGSKDLADALAGAVYNCEEGWRKGECQSPLFQMGLVQYAGGDLPPDQQARQEAIAAKIVAGHQLTGQEENDILFRGLDQ